MPKSQEIMSDIGVLITGGAGFVGSAIVDAVMEKYPECKITVLDIQPEEDYEKLKPARVAYLRVDLRVAVEVSRAVALVKPKVVVHTAGLIPAGAERYRRTSRLAVNRMNVQGTLNILGAAKACGVAAFIYTSSCCVVTDDLDCDYPNYNEETPIPTRSLIYGESKAMAESHVLEANNSDFSTCSLRPSVIFGERDHSLIPSIHACIVKGETPFIIGSGDNLWDFTYVTNVADAHVLALENLLSTRTVAGHAVLITNGQPVTFRDFCVATWAAFGHFPSYNIAIPAAVAWSAGLAAECMTWFAATPSTLSRGSVKDALGCRYADGSKARTLLGYRPRVDLGEGIRRSCEGYMLKLKQDSG